MMFSQYIIILIWEYLTAASIKSAKMLETSIDLDFESQDQCQEFVDNALLQHLISDAACLEEY
jgi:hypothetical protein